MNNDCLTVIGIVISFICVPLSVFGSWYYNRIRKIKLIYNNFIYFIKKDQLDINAVQEMYLNNLINEFEMKSESGNEFIENIRNYRNIFNYKIFLKNIEKDMIDLFKSFDFYQKIDIINDIYDNKSKLCQYFSCKEKWNDMPIYENKKDTDIINDIEIILNDKKLKNLTLNLNSFDKISNFYNYYLRKEYKNNVFFIHESIDYSINHLMNEFNNHKKTYEKQTKEINELESKISKKYIKKRDLVKYDIDKIINSCNISNQLSV